MSTGQKVLLIGGPLHGKKIRMNPTRNLITLEHHRIPSDWFHGHATKVGISSYRRVDERTFRFCATQTAMGETDVPFWEDQPNLEEDL